jgi:hypothetical protein
MSDDTEDQFEDFEIPLTEEEKKLEAWQKTKDLNRSLFCKFCGKPKHDHWVYDKDGKLKKDQYGTIFRRICKEELEHNLTYYYDENVLKNNVVPRPETTPLTELFSVDKILRRGFISHAYVISSLETAFPSHLKAFIKFITQDQQAKKFKYKILDFPELREIKFGKDHDFSYTALDEFPLLIFDLEKEAHDNRADENNLLELIVHRHTRNKALWFISPYENIRNRHLTDAEISKKVYAGKTIDLRSKKEKNEPPKGGNDGPSGGGGTTKSEVGYVPPPTAKPKTGKRSGSIPASLPSMGV